MSKRAEGRRLYTRIFRIETVCWSYISGCQLSVLSVTGVRMSVSDDLQTILQKSRTWHEQPSFVILCSLTIMRYSQLLLNTLWPKQTFIIQGCSLLFSLCYDNLSLTSLTLVSHDGLTHSQCPVLRSDCDQHNVLLRVHFLMCDWSKLIHDQ